VDYVQFDTNRVGGITQAREDRGAGRGAPGAGDPARPAQMQQLPHRHGQPQLADGGSSSPRWTWRSANELFWYIFDGEPVPTDGVHQPRRRPAGAGVDVYNEASLKRVPRDRVRTFDDSIGADQ